jgi:hypothetical protein
MSEDRSVRKLAAKPSSDGEGVDLLAIAHALEEEFGVALPRAQLARVGSYAELLQLIRDELADGTDASAEDALSTCFVRARIVTGGSDGRVALVRVGWLTPDLVAAVADDVRQAPTGTWLQVLVPDNLSDTEIAEFHQWLRAMVSAHVRIDVLRTADRSEMVSPAVTSEIVRPSVTGECGDLTHCETESADAEPPMRRIDAGTHLAFSAEKQQLQCTQRRRSES